MPGEEAAAGEEDGAVVVVEHAMLNAVVINYLVDFFPDLVDLRKFRSVCKFWHHHSLRRWRQLAQQVKLGEPTKSACAGPSSSNNCAGNADADTCSSVATSKGKGWPIDKFLQFFHQLDNQDSEVFTHWRVEPFTRYLFQSVNLKLNSAPAVQVFDADQNTLPPGVLNFWELVGPSVTHLTFSHCQFQGDLKGIFENIVVIKLPTLQSLKLNNCRVIPRKSGMYDSRIQFYGQDAADFQADVKRNLSLKSLDITGLTPMCFYQLLISCPNLDWVKLSTSLEPQNSDYRFWPLFKTLGWVRPACFQQLFEIRTLDLMSVLLFEDERLNRWHEWRDKGLNLPFLEYLAITLFQQRLHYDANWNGDNREDVENILSPLLDNHGETLKTLKVFRPPVFGAPRETPFTERMDKLEELYLWGNLLKDLEFLRKLPNLQVLHVAFKCLDQLDKLKQLFYKGKNRTRQVERFRARYRPRQDPGLVRHPENQVLGRLVKWHWDVELQSSIVLGIPTWMPRLKVMEVVLGKTAFEQVCCWVQDLEELVLLWGSRLDDKVLTGWKEEGVGQGQRNENNLTQLKRLTRFEVKGLCTGEETRLGDMSVYEGLLQLPKLQRCSITAADSMSAEAEAALKLHVRLNGAQIIRKHPMDRKLECCKVSKFYEKVLGFGARQGEHQNRHRQHNRDQELELQQQQQGRRGQGIRRGRLQQQQQNQHHRLQRGIAALPPVPPRHERAHGERRRGGVAQGAEEARRERPN